MTNYKKLMSKIILQIKVIPGSSANKIVGEFVDCNGKKYHKINIKAPAQDGKANDELIKFLANEFGVKKSQIVINKGATARIKLVEIVNKIIS